MTTMTNDSGKFGSNTGAGANTSAKKSITAAYLFWFFLGGFGVHRMYMGKMGSGLGMLGLFVASMVGTLFVVGLVGFAALGVWWVADAFMINKWFKQGQVGAKIQARIASDPMNPPMSNAA